MAMEARCYRGGDNRTKMKQSIFARLDYISWAIIILLIVCVFLTRPL